MRSGKSSAQEVGLGLFALIAWARGERWQLSRVGGAAFLVLEDVPCHFVELDLR
jgi:hypothetical protein